MDIFSKSASSVELSNPNLCSILSIGEDQFLSGIKDVSLWQVWVGCVVQAQIDTECLLSRLQWAVLCRCKLMQSAYLGDCKFKLHICCMVGLGAGA